MPGQAACPTRNKAFEGGLWCGRDARTTKRSVEVYEVGGSTARFEEVAGAGEIVVAEPEVQGADEAVRLGGTAGADDSAKRFQEKQS